MYISASGNPTAALEWLDSVFEERTSRILTYAHFDLIRQDLRFTASAKDAAWRDPQRSPANPVLNEKGASSLTAIWRSAARVHLVA